MSHVYIHQPRLRSGCTLTLTEDRLLLHYRGEEFVIEADDDIRLDQIDTFLKSLDGTRTEAQLAANGELSPERVREFLSVLDENWLLDDGKAPEFKGKSGLQFIFELEDLYRGWLLETGETELTRQILDGEASQDVLVGWAFEYYHITRRAHDCISPAIAKAQGRMKQMAIDFFTEEYRHDKLISKSLQAAGYTQEQVASTVPLPFTNAVSNLLARFAHTDLLSFMAALFVFEGTSQNGVDYIEALNSYDMPEGFAEHQVAHTHINMDGDHYSVSREFFANVEYMTHDEQARVIRNIRMLHESYMMVHHQAVTYYSQPDAVVPRLIGSLTKTTQGGTQR